jgi:hypothetical protein
MRTVLECPHFSSPLVNPVLSYTQSIRAKPHAHIARCFGVIASGDNVYRPVFGLRAGARSKGTFSTRWDVLRTGGQRPGDERTYGVRIAMMQYLTCAGCRLKVYRGAGFAGRPCPRCQGELSPKQRSPGKTPSVTRLLGLQRRIAARIRGGGSLEDVQREIIAAAPVDELHRPGLRLYARDMMRSRGRGSMPVGGQPR